nr:MAG TPA: hypothetical protein [Caudoviricetes sp.]
MTTKPAVTKKAPRAAAKPASKTKRAPVAQTTLATLITASNTQTQMLTKVIDILTAPSKLPAQIVLQHLPEAAPVVSLDSNARLDAVLEMICGKGAQHFIQDIWDSGRPPTREMILRKADEVIARTGRRVG